MEERRRTRRYVITENISGVLKDLRNGEVVVDLSTNGARIISLDPKRIGDGITFVITLPKSLGRVELKGINVRCKSLKIDGKIVYETGLNFEGMSQFDSIILKRFMDHLAKEEILVQGRAKIKELLTATKKLKKNILVLKCKLHPPKEKDTTQ